ncbi:OmpA family protein [Larkinella arboricola]
MFSAHSALAQSGPRLVRTHVTEFVLKALDEQTKAELSATYRIKVTRSKREFNGQSSPGRPFVFSLGKTDTLIINTSVEGYYPMEEVLLVPCDTCANYEHLALMEKIESEKAAQPDSIFRNLKVNDKIRLDNVYFDQSSYVLRKESYPQLDKLLNTLNSYPKLVIEIAGHTDNVGDRRLNQSLSENRARVITNYLIQRGVAARRLQYQGYGDTRPAAPNDNEANKKKNRRVEFTVLAN